MDKFKIINSKFHHSRFKIQNLRFTNKQSSIFNLQSSIKNKGFSFFEAMVTVAVLSLGLVIIYQAFLTSLNTFSYYLTHLQAQCWANEKIWEVSDKLVHEDSLSIEETNGSFIIDSKDITWSMDISPIDEKEKFFKLSLILSWQEGKRKIKVRRDAYAGI